jgi:hypothetical protein
MPPKKSLTQQTLKFFATEASCSESDENDEDEDEARTVYI